METITRITTTVMEIDLTAQSLLKALVTRQMSCSAPNVCSVTGWLQYKSFYLMNKFRDPTSRHYYLDAKIAWAFGTPQGIGDSLNGTDFRSWVRTGKLRDSWRSP